MLLKLRVTLLAVLLVAVQANLATWTGVNNLRSDAFGSQPFSPELYRELYSLEDAGGNDLFTNKVDGYSFLVSKGFTVDMSLSGVGAVLEKPGLRIEVYKQYVGNIGRRAYISYSNYYLKNSTDYVLHYDYSWQAGSLQVDALYYSRDKLARIADDNNHYLCLELAFWPYHYNYTIMLKSHASLGGVEVAEYLAANFTAFAPTAAPYTRLSSPPDLSQRGFSSAAEAFYRRYFDSAAPLAWGIFEPRSNWLDYSTLEFYESYFAYEFPILLDYTDFSSKIAHFGLQDKLSQAKQRNKTLLLTLQTTYVPGERNMLYAVLDGEYDAFIRDYARKLAAIGEPVLFRLGNEMNGDWCPYSAIKAGKDTTVFQAFYRYIYALFRQEGADNVIWVWNPNGRSFPNFLWNHELMYYPGDSYVDIVGLTAYNTGTYYYNYGERWQSFAELYDDLYRGYLRLYGQPLMITEFASASMGGDKEQWVRDMFAHIVNMERIKVAVWWDAVDYDTKGNVARSYVIDETPELMAIFRANLGGKD
ncbi:MAG: glycoside hydrolase family 26 protein [Symbiobacteriaceae bacterium]|nr:glycoside hydrolase family 26 protein [Symbiobacteriaceae bacterium]